MKNSEKVKVILEVEYEKCSLASLMENIMEIGWIYDVRKIQSPEAGVEEIDTLLLICQRAVEDAIGCEDDLDGATGMAVLDEINDYRKKHNLPIYQSPESLGEA